jgi:geranylgeranyl diphosphate synthase type I
MIRAIMALTLRGGKRVRPALAYGAANCFDHGLDESALLDGVLSLELLQTYLLIHDDVMDDDDQRRGGPAVHVVLSEQSGSENLGRSLAILAGDLACAMAQELLLHPALPPQRVRAALAELARMQWDVIQGQQLDLLAGAPPEAIHDAKTASYTTRGPLRLGAVLAGAPAHDVERMERLGRPLGRAFQVRDDLLGVFGRAEATGKPVGADLRAGKRTELVEYALTRGSADQQKEVRALLGQRDAPEAQVQRVCAILEQTGARQWSEDLVLSLTEQAQEALRESSWQEEGAAFLSDITRRLAKRDR